MSQIIMSLADFTETYLVDEIEDYVQESYWTRDFKTDWCLELVEAEAKARGITIPEADLDNYDKFFYDWYQMSEKGLS